MSFIHLLVMLRPGAARTTPTTAAVLFLKKALGRFLKPRRDFEKMEEENQTFEKNYFTNCSSYPASTNCS